MLKIQHYMLFYGSPFLISLSICTFYFHLFNFSLNLWGVPKGNDDLLNPLCSSGTNPNSLRVCPSLSVEFETGAHPIVFPDDKQIQEYAEFLSRLDSKQEATSTELTLLRDIEKRDPLSEISEQEKELLWKYRLGCRDMPNILP